MRLHRLCAPRTQRVHREYKKCLCACGALARPRAERIILRAHVRLVIVVNPFRVLHGNLGGPRASLHYCIASHRIQAQSAACKVRSRPSAHQQQRSGARAFQIPTVRFTPRARDERRRRRRQRRRPGAFAKQASFANALALVAACAQRATTVADVYCVCEHDCAVGWKMIAHARQILDNHQSVSMRAGERALHTHTPRCTFTQTHARTQTYWRAAAAAAAAMVAHSLCCRASCDIMHMLAPSARKMCKQTPVLLESACPTIRNDQIFGIKFYGRN